jgi:hypothetical protein
MLTLHHTPKREVKRKKLKGKSGGLPPRRRSNFHFLLLPFALILVRQVRFELTVPCLRDRYLEPFWLLARD